MQWQKHYKNNLMVQFFTGIIFEQKNLGCLKIFHVKK